MKVIEFRTTIKDGKIEIPRQYLRGISREEKVRVILMVEKPAGRSPDIIDKLLSHPIRLKGFRPLSREAVHAEQ